MSNPVLAVSNLRTEVRKAKMWRTAVDGISLSIRRNETLALVGESGCGKSLTALSIMHLLPAGSVRTASGSIMLDGTDLTLLPQGQLDWWRGNRMGMIFQEPMTSLNPVMTIGAQIREPLRIHKRMSRHDAHLKALELMDKVKIPAAKSRIDEYPHQFSGGMRQRAMIALAIACEPDLLLADEPTTALDVTIQSQVLRILNELKARYGMTMLFITHNLGVVAQIADRVAVMYAGQIIEKATVSEIFARPGHPYTRALFASIPRADRSRSTQDLKSIPGRVPSLDAMPAGCRFAARCPLARAGCDQPQQLVPVSPDHEVRCHVETEALA